MLKWSGLFEKSPIFRFLEAWCVRTALSIVECQLLSLTKVPLNNQKEKIPKWKKVIKDKKDIKMKRVLFEGRTPAKIIVSYRKKKKRNRTDHVWLLCPVCKNSYRLYFQTNRGKSMAVPVGAVVGAGNQPGGSSLGRHPHQLPFWGVFFRPGPVWSHGGISPGWLGPGRGMPVPWHRA